VLGKVQLTVASDRINLFSQHLHICKDAICFSGANRALTDFFNTLFACSESRVWHRHWQ